MKRTIYLPLVYAATASLLLSACQGANVEESADTTQGTTLSVETEETSEPESESAEETTQEEVTQLEFDMTKATQSTTFTIDGNAVLTGEAYAYDGLGFISANNSSRLLLDYKSENPEAYWQLIRYVFGQDGLNMSLLKIEMGADVDSSSGTEPCVKRSADEEADVTRGAGYQLAADALSVNPNLHIDMLYWGLPNWVSTDGSYEARYQWYKQTIDSLYATYGVKTTYVTATQNEKAVDTDWIKYLRNALDAETDCAYDYSSIQIVAGEGVCSWGIADQMLKDEELMDAVDVISAHYTSWSSANAKKLQSEYGKKVWFSEGSSPMAYETTTCAWDGNGSGLSGLNGMLDIATRLTQAMTEGMTMYEFQPVISAYYDGVTYYPKQLITANSPWSGGYSLDAGYYMGLHFAQFIQPGWQMVDGACYGDGKAGGDGHAIVDSTFNYVTFVSDDLTDTSVVLVNNSADTVAYEISLANLNLASDRFYVWQTKGPDAATDADYYENMFQKLGYITPVDDTLTLVLEPYSMMTVSTLDVTRADYASVENEPLALPYTDDFEYADHDADFLASRGNAPLYTTDQGGAFEVAEVDGNQVLMQQITEDIKPTDWGYTSDPTTNLGDDTWSNYTVSVDVHFADDPTDSSNSNYVGLGARYNLADYNCSGYWIKLKEDGRVELTKTYSPVANAAIENFDTSKWYNLSLTVNDNVITVAVDGQVLITYTDENAVVCSGRVALYSYLQKNYFDKLKVTAIDGAVLTNTRIDNLDAELSYSEGSTEDDGNGWYHNLMSSFKNYHRTASIAAEGSSVSFPFDGTCFAVLGKSSNLVLKVTVDGEVLEDGNATYSSDYRQAAYSLYGLADGSHEVSIEVVSGSLELDAVEFH